MDIEKRALQLVILVGGLAPVLAGAAGVAMGAGMVSHVAVEPSLTSHFRYLSGLLLAIGLGFWSAVPGIEHKGGRIRLLAVVVVVGGLARAYGLARGDAPDMAMRLALVMELGVTPLLCLWQARVASAHACGGSGFRPDPGRAAPLQREPRPGRPG
jgi:hypothetical protein